MNTAAQHVSINHGVDFERALDVLNAKAGKAYREYRSAMRADHANATDIDALRQVWIDAQRDVEGLDRHDAARIREVLEAEHT